MNNLAVSPLASQKDRILAAVQKAKDERRSFEVQDEDGNVLSVMRIMENTPEIVKCIADWREQAKHTAPTIFPYNLENTAKWIDKGVMGNPERILFMLFTPQNEPWGHLGLGTFTWEGEPACELDAVMRGREDLARGAMTEAVRTLLRWTRDELKITRITLRVFEDNARAIRLYERLGFRRSHTIPMLFEPGDPISSWRPCKDGEKPGRFFLVMELPADVSLEKKRIER